MFLDQVILVSSIPVHKSSRTTASESVYRHNPKKTSSAKSSSTVDAAAPVGQIHQLDLSGSATFGVKITPFSFKEASIPLNCLTPVISRADGFSNDVHFAAYHPILSGLFLYAPGRDRPVSRSFGHEGLMAIAGSPCGKYLAGGFESGTLAIWRISTGELVSVRESAHFQAIRLLRFSPDGQRLASGAADALCKIWSFSRLLIPNLAKDSEEFSFSHHSAPICDVLFSKTAIGGRGRLVTGSLDGSVALYDLIDGQLLAILKFPKEITCIAINSTETVLFAGSMDGNIYSCDLTPINVSGQAFRNVMAFHRGPISALKWSLEERVLISTGLQDGQVAFWDPFTRQLIKSVSLGTEILLTNVLVSGRSDPVHLSLNTTASTGASASSMYPPSSFKRLGNQVVPISSAVPLLPEASSAQMSSNNQETTEMLRDLTSENTELRQINADLCNIVCKGHL